MEGDLLGARFQLARALDRERDNPNLLAQLVEISRNLGDTQDSLTYLQRLVKGNPTQSINSSLASCCSTLVESRRRFRRGQSCCT